MSLHQKTINTPEGNHSLFGHQYQLRNTSSKDSTTDLQTLCRIGFNSNTLSINPHSITTGLNLIAGDHTAEELWVLESGINLNTCKTFRSDMCSWIKFGDMMLISAYSQDDQNLAKTTELLYSQIFEHISSNDTPFPLRIWNYLPNINQGDGDNENYRQFCLGRKKSFDKAKLDSNNFPAASALGHHQKGIIIYALCSASAGLHFENPSQVSAYRYPREYGPKSPSFARATMVKNGKHDILYFSGTASVVGHKTVGQDDIEVQTQVTIDNLKQLFEHIYEKAQLKTPLNLASLKIYIRHEHHYEIVAQMLESAFPSTPSLFLHADICRKDLLVEVDGHCTVNTEG